jgi:pimeloyl-ACP methyl ester carboxylesterase
MPGANTPNPPKASAKTKARAKKIAIVLAASLVGFSVTNIAASIAIYDTVFERYDRPDYTLYPGIYCYERIEGELKRETLSIPSGENKLAAYYYPAKKPRGLCVLAHGIHAGADDYLPLISAIVKRGYSVFTYDVTGVYSSEGESAVGMCQSLRDLDRAITYLKEDARFKDMPKVVIGHSWGGYAASSVLALHPDVKAAALIAPMNDGSKVVLEKGEQYVGKLALSAKPIFDIYQKMLFGDYVKFNGVMGINSTNAHIFIAQGIDDTVITPDGQSITAHLDELTNPNVTVYWGEGSEGSHTGIWHSVESEEYQRVIESKRKKLRLDLGESRRTTSCESFIKQSTTSFTARSTKSLSI